MATLYFGDTGFTGDLDSSANWWTNSGLSTPAGRIPNSGDDVIFGQSPDFVSTGTLVCDDITLTGVTVTMSPVFNHVGTCTITGNVNGGIFNGEVDIASSGMVSDGTFNDFVHITAGQANGGFFHGDVLVDAPGYIVNGTFNGEVDLSAGGTLMNGDFHGLVIIGSGVGWSGGTYRNKVQVPAIHASFASFMMSWIQSTASISFDDGTSFFYRNTSTGVADPSEVQDGVINLDETGTLEVPGEPDYPAESDVRAGVDYDEFTGTLDLPAESDVRDGVEYADSDMTGTLGGGTVTIEVE